MYTAYMELFFKLQFKSFIWHTWDFGEFVWPKTGTVKQLRYKLLYYYYYYYYYYSILVAEQV